MRILGIDPGLRHTGWGILHQQGYRLTYVAHGCISPSSTLPLSSRLETLFAQLCTVIEEWKPNQLAIEEVFMNPGNPLSALKLGMARGVALMVGPHKGIPVGEYTANQVKKAVVGRGHAEKSQVSFMVRTLLAGCPTVQADSADALAVAICHAHTIPSALYKL